MRELTLEETRTDFKLLRGEARQIVRVKMGQLKRKMLLVGASSLLGMCLLLSVPLKYYSDHLETFQRGASTVAIVDTVARSRGIETVFYEYAVKGKAYRANGGIAVDIRPGEIIPIRYRKDRPEMSATNTPKILWFDIWFGTIAVFTLIAGGFLNHACRAYVHLQISERDLY